MFDNPFSLSDIRIEVIDTADRYMKTVLINSKHRYFRVLRKQERYGITIFELEKYESNLAYEEAGYHKVDTEHFVVGNETITLERSELTEALLSLTPMQLEILLKSVFMDISQEKLAAEYGITKRMVQKHKYAALKKLRRRLTYEAQG